MIKYITDAFNDKNIISIDLIFLDFSNAFNLVDHEKLFKKLSEIGISGNFLKIVIDSFKNRKKFVSYNDCNSDINELKNGIPQGGISSPIYFNIYKSDMTKCINNSKVFEFSDDTVLVKIIKKDSDRHELQSDLDNIYEWCIYNKLLLNSMKTELLSIHTKPECMTSLYKIDSTYIKSVFNT